MPSSDSSSELEQTRIVDTEFVPSPGRPGTSTVNEYRETELESFPSTSRESKSKRARKDMLTARLSAALDKCKISDRDAVHMLTACVEAVKIQHWL